MGAWSVSVTGNDTAQDLISEYQVAFYCYDVETSLKKIDAYVRQDFNESDQEEWCNYYYSLADYMWKHGILTEAVREQAVEMIDSGFGLELWAESGAKVLEKRKKALAEFRAKILGPQPPKKKIKINFHRNTIFETGDLVAIQLQTADRNYIRESCLSPQEFCEADGKFVVLRKVWDSISYCSAIEPSVKDIWAVFQLYKKLFDDCPTPEQIQGIPFVETREPGNTFTSESSLFYFRKRKYRIIGNDITGIEQLERKTNTPSFLFFSVNKPWCNPETKILEAVLKGKVLK